MGLDTYSNPEDLYLARGDQVNPNRPFFTGDVFGNLAIPGVNEDGMALILAHPCSFRIGDRLNDRLLIARVNKVPKQGAKMWSRGLFDQMPLPDVDGPGYWAAHLDLIGRSCTSDLSVNDRIACLSEVGINMLQQRLAFHLTRAEIPTDLFNKAFSHTLEEADLLEDWIDTLTSHGWSKEKATKRFEEFIRSGEPSFQHKLLDIQSRSAVRRESKRMALQLFLESELQ